MQTAATAYFSSKKLLLFAFAGQICFLWLPLDIAGGRCRLAGWPVKGLVQFSQGCFDTNLVITEQNKHGECRRVWSPGAVVAAPALAACLVRRSLRRLACRISRMLESETHSLKAGYF